MIKHESRNMPLRHESQPRYYHLSNIGRTGITLNIGRKAFKRAPGTSPRQLRKSWKEARRATRALYVARTNANPEHVYDWLHFCVKCGTSVEAVFQGWAMPKCDGKLS